VGKRHRTATSKENNVQCRMPRAPTIIDILTKTIE
jgi:hypothetical protein